VGNMGKSKVVTVRLDKETLGRIKDKYGSVSDFVKEAINVLFESPQSPLSSTALPEIAEKLIEEFKEVVKRHVERAKQFCEEHAREITTIHEKEKDKYDYWRDTCLHRYRTITRSNLNVFIKDKLLPRVISSLDANQKAMLEKRLNDIINEAVKEIYISEYPPIYPS
jgi:Arc/MetJ-type ribon-helix-helix transcriptional regulator